jgi:hypothetical protein
MSKCLIGLTHSERGHRVGWRESSCISFYKYIFWAPKYILKKKQCMNTLTFGFIEPDNSNCQSQLSLKSQKSNCHSMCFQLPYLAARVTHYLGG